MDFPKWLFSLNFMFSCFKNSSVAIKIIFISWIVLTIVIILSMFSFYRKYTLIKTKTHINKLLQDYEKNIPEIRKNFNIKNIEIQGKLISKNLINSTTAINSFNNNIKEFVNIINNSIDELKRNINDILLENYEIEDINNMKEFKEEKIKLNELIEKSDNLKKEFEKGFKERGSENLT